MSEKLSSLILPIKNEQTGQNENKEFKIMVKETNKEPYVSRTARDGLVKIPQLVGATVAWNQLVQNGNFSNTSVWVKFGTNYTVSNNEATITVNNPSGTGSIYQLIPNIKASHKYFITASVKSSDGGEIAVRTDGGLGAIENRTTSTSYVQISLILNALSTHAGRFILTGYPANQELKAKNCMVIDLTQMFGTTIADYVYSLEQATEGSGIAWLKSYGFFTKDYYAYDVGSLQSVCTSGRKITDLSGNERTYLIDDVQLRGLFKLDANNKLYADGDIYPPSGSGTRKYGIVNLGSLDWQYSITDPTNLFFHTGLPEKAIGNTNIICSKYATSTDVPFTRDMADKTIKGYGSNKKLYIKDSSYTDLETFKNSLDNVYMVYELATETTFSADPYINPQRSEGTEEFVDGLTRDVMIPVGNESTYFMSEVLPSAADYTDEQINNHNHDDRYYTEAETDNLINELQANFQDGVDDVYDAVVAKGSTPASKSLSDVIAGIGAIPSGGGITPTGTIEITENGIVDVTRYANADVQVPNTPTVISHGNVWEPSDMKGPMTGLDGKSIWTDGENVYYSKEYDANHMMLDKTNNEWISKTWNGYTNIDGVNIWSDGENTYYSYRGSQYVLDKATSTWSKKTWNGLTSFDGKSTWTDGENIYYSSFSSQYVLDKATSTWSKKTWNGLTNFYGDYVWSDGNNIYFSGGTEQYILNKATDTWSEIQWSNQSSYLSGESVWSDGTNFYFSSPNSSVPIYLINTANTSLEKVTSWYASIGIGANYIWTDGENIYYSNWDLHYVFNKTTNVWQYKTWNNAPTFYGHEIWTDGENVYLLTNGVMYILDKATSTWSEVYFDTPEPITGVWSDGEHLYAVNRGGNKTYVLSDIVHTKPD